MTSEQRRLGLGLLTALGVLYLLRSTRYGAGRRLHNLRREVERLAREKKP